MPPVGFEPAIPVGDRPQTHALDRSATGIGSAKCHIYFVKLKNKLAFFSWLIDKLRAIFILATLVECKRKETENVHSVMHRCL
jgi:hypothetical protein